MSFEVGIPVCNEVELLVDCLKAIARSSIQPDCITIIDNGDIRLDVLSMRIRIIRPNQNIGCAGAWNMLHKLTAPASLIILNPDTIVAPDTFEKMMLETSGLVLGYGYGCFRIEDWFWKQVGDFDEGFYPVYCEDVDHRYRVKLLGLPFVEWDYTKGDVKHGKVQDHYQGWAGDKEKWFRDCLEKNKARFVRKWGGTPYEEKFLVPFDGVLEK